VTPVQESPEQAIERYFRSGAQYVHGPMPADDQVDAAKYRDILAEAVAALIGWKRILAKCAPLRQGPRREFGTA
jgi:hypothetical protein